MSIPAIGEKIAQSVVEFFANPDNQRLIADLKEVGVSLEAAGDQQGEAPGRTDVCCDFGEAGAVQSFRN